MFYLEVFLVFLGVTLDVALAGRVVAFLTVGFFLAGLTSATGAGADSTLATDPGFSVDILDL
jgi:hypothetical protein